MILVLVDLVYAQLRDDQYFLYCTVFIHNYKQVRTPVLVHHAPPFPSSVERSAWSR